MTRPPRSRSSAGRPPAPFEGTVESLGDRGDGLIRVPDSGALFYVPDALPGERVRVRPLARKADGWTTALDAVLEPSPERITPPCPHADVCGGCAILHWAPDAVAAWKRDLVVRALARRGLADACVRATVSLPPGTRRRLNVGLRGRQKAAVVGFCRRASHELVDTPHCLLPTPALARAMADLRRLGPSFLAPGETADALLTDTDAGLDLVLTPPKGPDLALREALAALAENADLAQLSMGPTPAQAELLAGRRALSVDLGGVEIRPPAGPFLQPSREGERALQALVLEALADLPARAGVADLFCGVGTFSLPLARAGYRVRAHDNAPASLRALARTGRVEASERDLFRAPLTGSDLAELGAVVLDPPRAGAQAQVQVLAEAGPPRLALVSCAPGTFARDARILVDGGYRLEWVAPVDQFTGSAHVEVVARFVRDAPAGSPRRAFLLP
ncbi:class I SAM-dependent RNA methyltransferase [Pararhodospirillum oryzae]|uniref:23S rRNA methyltransferase n=1 Tax=Pararhodospirillum oryzae TaxID=478448 RepID=A0A512H6R1_9PROT|nr:class I SAM-dependent RNA methyltransferase [Pararhodospirillum oryzae]GEO81155.1 23S rRNA methyltransferase [Pararhodospirillum oryzae]